MKKKYFVLSAVVVLIVVISFGLGYTYAFVEGLEKVNDMHARVHGDILLIHSLTLTRKLRSPDTVGLIEATELNGDNLADFIIGYKPYIKNPEISRRVEEALTAWEPAKKRLQELRALRSKNTEDSP